MYSNNAFCPSGFLHRNFFFKLRNVHSPAHRAMEETTYTGWSKVKIWSRDLMSLSHTSVAIPILRRTCNVLVEVPALWVFLDSFSRAELSQHCGFSAVFCNYSLRNVTHWLAICKLLLLKSYFLLSCLYLSFKVIWYYMLKNLCF